MCKVGFYEETPLTCRICKWSCEKCFNNEDSKECQACPKSKHHNCHDENLIEKNFIFILIVVVIFLILLGFLAYRAYLKLIEKLEK